MDGFLSLVSAATLSQVLEQIRFNPFFKCSCLRETRLLTDCFVYSKGDQGAPGVEGSDGPPGLRVSTFARQNLARTPFTFQRAVFSLNKLLKLLVGARRFCREREKRKKTFLPEAILQITVLS